MIDEEAFERYRDQLGELLVILHKTTTWLAFFSFCGYAVAAFYLYRGNIPLALGIATASYLFFRLFRPVSLAILRRMAALRDDLWPAMEWLDAQIAEHGAEQVISWLDDRLFPKP
ncbi:MAG: hypothetical protein D6717_08210 [Gammaproteobacteria bacterium]|nr:MAG: hypothetical protein D6717_08210 [Gammaproteobacteria bacterium]